MQLALAPLAAPSSSPNNVVMPTSVAPNAVIAPFWDDLSPIASDVRATTLGSGDTRRFVVQWTHWTLKANNAVRFTFQAKLFQNGNIEFHYCAMSADGAASATIGVETWSGTTATQHSFGTANAAPTGSALRFTPK